MFTINELLELPLPEAAKVVAHMRPRDSDEFYWWVLNFTGYQLPRKSVCPEHVAPLIAAWRIFDEEVLDAVLFANRSGGKTVLMAVLNLADMLFKPQCEIATVGAILPQARKGYKYLTQMLQTPLFKDDVVETLMRETSLANGSSVEIVSSSTSGLNSPHPNKARADEVELMDWDSVQQFFSMAVSSPGIKAQQVLSSTRKCGIATDRVLTAEGKLVPLVEFKGGEVLSLGPDLKNIVAVATASEPNGAEPCVKVRTRFGKVVTVTLNHPLRRFDGWVEAGKLKIGDYIAAPRSIPFEGKEPLPDGDARFLGLIIGDGCVSVKDQVMFSSADLHPEMKILCDRNGWFYRQKSKYDLCLLGDPSLWRTERNLLNGRFEPAEPRSPLGVVRHYGISGQNSHTKRVPDAVFTAPNAQVAEFIGAYFSCDGTVSKKQLQVIFWSVNDGLLRDVQHLLLRFGICAVLGSKRGKYRGKVHLSRSLNLYGDDVHKFAKVIPVLGKKGDELDTLLVRFPRSRASSIDQVPPGWRGVVEHTVLSYKRKSMPRWVLADFGKWMLTLGESDVLWDRIIEIEDVGLQETFAVTVPGPANLVVNDVYWHNTLVGSMQKLLDRCEKDPSFTFRVFAWCIFETIETCRRPSCDECKGVVRGDGETFEEHCAGKARDADGFYPIEDAHRKFKLLDADVWDAEWEGKKPSRGGLVIGRQWDDAVHWQPWVAYDPSLPTYGAVDFGYDAPFSSGVGQIDAMKNLYMLEEYYGSELSVSKQIIPKLLEQQATYNVLKWFCDATAPAQIRDFRDAGVRAVPCTRDRKQSYANVRSYLTGHSTGRPRMVMNQSMESTKKDVLTCHYQKGQQDVVANEHSHGVDMLCYLIWGIMYKLGDQTGDSGGEMPTSGGDGRGTKRKHRA